MLGAALGAVALSMIWFEIVKRVISPPRRSATRTGGST
jgi:hypothetical protein